MANKPHFKPIETLNILQNLTSSNEIEKNISPVFKR